MITSDKPNCENYLVQVIKRKSPHAQTNSEQIIHQELDNKIASEPKNIKSSKKNDSSSRDLKIINQENLRKLEHDSPLRAPIDLNGDNGCEL